MLRNQWLVAAGASALLSMCTPHHVLVYSLYNPFLSNLCSLQAGGGGRENRSSTGQCILILMVIKWLRNSAKVKMQPLVIKLFFQQSLSKDYLYQWLPIFWVSRTCSLERDVSTNRKRHDFTCCLHPMDGASLVCAALFLACYGLVPYHGSGVWDPWPICYYIILHSILFCPMLSYPILSYIIFALFYIDYRW